ncbi:MAG TPA: hypothetical protein VGQ62_23110 [Chloroflexota bacterium]|jgi:hypothetical protein|nr:hypothetical protein [Chloroflexota bacterium]
MQPAGDAGLVRIERREARISQGVDDLERWLHDFARAGLAEAGARPWSNFEQMSARLVDAQAPGLARLVRELGGLPYIATNWPERMLIDLGQLALLLDAWRGRRTLPADLRADVRSLVGINEPRDAVLASAAVSDTWTVLGRRVLVGERFVVQRTWLWGAVTRRWALLLEFAIAGQQLERRYVPGRAFSGELHFYSGAVPLRALMAEPLQASEETVASLPVQPIGGMLTTYAERLGRNPWLERMPAGLDQVIPQRGRDEAWWLGDRNAGGARLPCSGPLGWHLAALSGGHPIDVFGEWDGFSFWPLLVHAGADQRLVPLRAPEAP